MDADLARKMLAQAGGEAITAESDNVDAVEDAADAADAGGESADDQVAEEADSSEANANTAPDEFEDVHLPAAVLDELAPQDLPENVRMGIGEVKDNIVHLDWSGVLVRSGQDLNAEVDLTWTRKYWYLPINLEHYLDLVRRAIERREATRGDVKLVNHDDDGAYVQLVYAITGLPSKTLGDAYRAAKKIASELEEIAERASEEAGQVVAAAAQRADGWGNLPLDQLVEKVETTKNPNLKGSALEELTARLFETISGLTTIGRIRTVTEEIDVTILNGSTDPRFSRESAVILVECKNWSSKCGKNEFVIFQSKLTNRSERCSLGFLISWNGFTGTVTSEMLRGSRERTLIVPLEGKQIRSAVREVSFEKLVFDAWQNAVML